MIAHPPPLTITAALRAVTAYETRHAEVWRAEHPLRFSSQAVDFDVSEWPPGTSDQRDPIARFFVLHVTRRNGKLHITRD